MHPFEPEPKFPNLGSSQEPIVIVSLSGPSRRRASLLSKTAHALDVAWLALS